jgi:catechol 2,3-dioxygenase-like lactoylglutathione lyase family enzyme
MTEVKGMAACFLVSDVGATARWYREVLGFSFWTHPDIEPFEWASMKRGAAEIMLQRCHGYEKADFDALRPGGAWNAYLYVDEVDALHATIGERAEIRRAPEDQVYGMRELEIADPNGYVLVFGQDLTV